MIERRHFSTLGRRDSNEKNNKQTKERERKKQKRRSEEEKELSLEKEEFFIEKCVEKGIETGIEIGKGVSNRSNQVQKSGIPQVVFFEQLTTIE